MACLATFALAELDFVEAERFIEQGLAIDPHHVRLLMLKVRLLASQGQRERCATMLAERLRLETPDGPPNAPLLRLLLDLNFDDEANHWLPRAHAAHPTEAAVTEQWRRWLCQQGRSAEAFADELRAVKETFAQSDQGPRLLAIADRVPEAARRSDLLRRFHHHLEALL